MSFVKNTPRANSVTVFRHTLQAVMIYNVNYNYNYMAFIERKKYRNIHLRCTQGEIRFTKNDNKHIARIMYTYKNIQGQHKNQ